MSVSKRTLSSMALAAVAILATATVGYAAAAHGGPHGAPGFAAGVATARFEVRHVADDHGGGRDGHHFDGRDFHHRFHGNTAVAPLYWPYYYPYTYYVPAPNYYWYCPSYGAYYPSVETCPDDWVAVPTG